MADSLPLGRTTCPYCGVGCGVVVRRAADGSLAVSGDPDHPANHGLLCVKGAALPETMGLDGRLLHPMVGSERTSWGEALDTVAEGLTRTIREHGPDSVAFYVSGQLLTEDYYVANKLMKGFIGSGNIDTNSRLCMSSSVAGHTRAFGDDVVPGCYEDLDLADLVVLVGSNAAWCHPILFRRILAARDRRPGMRLVVIDPRRTTTAAEADLHLPIRSGTDTILFNGLLAWLDGNGRRDDAFVAGHTEGLEAALAAARTSPDPAVGCDIDAGLVDTFFRWFGECERTVTAFAQGVHQSTSGTDKVNAIINCHLLTGRIGRPGMGPFSLTGQPNAMGGREVGGLANQLAAHMPFTPETVDRVGRFWNAPAVATAPGLKAVDMFEAVADGRIKAIWIVATNPAVSLPDSDRVREGLARCPLVIVSDCTADTDTTRFAHVRLPALTWAEKDGTSTNSERCISRQRGLLPPPGEARPDWWMIAQVARRMGFVEAFDHAGPADVFREHARLSAFENDGRRVFDIGALAEADYDTLEPIQWPVSRDGGTARLFGDGRFCHAGGKARFVAIAPRPPAALPTPGHPLVLLTGRSRDQWHTMTRTGTSPRLSGHAPEPAVALHPDDLATLGLADGTLAIIGGLPGGQVLARATADPGLRPGEAFLPLHWNDQYTAMGVACRLVASATDPVSGQPEFKHAPVWIGAAPMAWHGVVLSRRPLTTWEDGVYWSRSAGTGHQIYRLVGASPVADWSGWVRKNVGEGAWIEYRDSRLGRYRAALHDGDGRLCHVVAITPLGESPSFDGFAAHFDQPATTPEGRAALLAGTGIPSIASPVVCACLGVRRDDITRAFAAGAKSVGDISALLKAGTNCGSCLPEISLMLRLFKAAQE